MGNMPVVEVGGRKMRVKRLLSESGHSHVYMAIDEVNKKDYALKMVRIPRDRSGQLANEEVAEMAVMEQSVVRSLHSNHPNIVRFHDCGINKADHEIRYYILSEYCPSNVLKKMNHAQDHGALLSEKEVMFIFRDTLMALLHLHNRDPPIAHRDIKVDNLLVGRDGLVKLCDFGSCSTKHRSYHGAQEISRAHEDIRRNTTLAYRSPEQVNLFQGHVVSEKVDVWALGVMLYKLAFYHTPFEDVRGNVDKTKILNGLGERKIPQEQHYSTGLVALIRRCLVVDPEKRPNILQVLKLCEDLHSCRSLPEWPGLDNLPRTPPHSSSSPYSPRPWDRADLPGSDRGRHHTAETSALTSHATPVNSIPSRSPDVTPSDSRPSPDQAKNGRMHTSARRPSITQGTLTPNSDTSARSKTPSVTSSPRRATTRMTRTHTGSGDPTWMARVGDGVRSKWYKLMGGEQRKRLWVLKTTSQSATGPKPKYVSKIVLALWEEQLTMGSFFMLVRFRPLAESPIVAMKALITLMKVLQQGPPHVLSETSTYTGVVDEIGQMWATPSAILFSGGNAGGSAGRGGGAADGLTPSGRRGSGTIGNEGDANAAVDPVLSALIVRFANMIVQKIEFHKHHPEFSDYWAASTDTMDSNTENKTDSYDTPNSERLPAPDANDEPRTLQVISRLLTVQGCILTTMQQAFVLLDKGAKDAGPCTRTCLLPLMAESYLTYVATTRVLLSVSEGYSGAGLKRAKPRPDELVALSDQYNRDLKVMQELYKKADEVEEVAVMKRTPRLPAVSPLSEGGAKQFREMSRKSSARSTFGRALSKMEALKTLQDEERRFIGSNGSQKSANAIFGSEDGNGSDDNGLVGGDHSDDDREGSSFLSDAVDNSGGESEKGSQSGVASTEAGGSISKVIVRGDRRDVSGDDDDDDDDGSWNGSDDSYDEMADGDDGPRQSGKPPRLELKDEGEWSNYCTWQGPNSRAPSSGQVQEGVMGVRREGDGGGGPKAWASGTSEVPAFPTHPGSLVPSAAPGASGVRVMKEDAERMAGDDGRGSPPPQQQPLAGLQEKVPATPLPSAAAEMVAAVLGAPSIEMDRSDPPSPLVKQQSVDGFSRSRRASLRGGRKEEASIDEIATGASRPVSLRVDMRHERSGDILSDFETLTMGGDSRPSTPSGAEGTNNSGRLSTKGQSTYIMQATGGSRKERPPPLPPRREVSYETGLNKLGGTGTTSSNEIGAADSAGLAAGGAAPPPLPPRHAGIVLDSSAIAGAQGQGTTGANMRLTAPPPPPPTPSSPLAVRGSPSLARPVEVQDHAAVAPRGGGSSGPRPTPGRRRDPQPTSPRFIKGGFGPAAPQSWTGAAIAAASSGVPPSINSGAEERRAPQGERRRAGTVPPAGSKGDKSVGHGTALASASASGVSMAYRHGGGGGGGGPDGSVVESSTDAAAGGVGSASRSAAMAATDRIGGTHMAQQSTPSKSRGSTSQRSTPHHGGGHRRSGSLGQPGASGNSEVSGIGALGASPSGQRRQRGGSGPVSTSIPAYSRTANASASATPTAGYTAVQVGGSSSSGSANAAPTSGAEAGGISGGGVGTGRIAIAKYEYVAQGPEQLSFRVGDVVHLHTEKVNAKGWGLGQANGKVGWFPGDFVDVRRSSTDRRSRGSTGAKSSSSRNRRSQGTSNAVGGASHQHGHGHGQGRGAPPPPPHPGRQQRARVGGNGDASAGELDRERVRGAEGGSKEPEQLPEHVFAIQMAKDQPWKDRLTPGGKTAYDDLLAFFKASRMVLDFDEMELKSVIGSGAFATVFRGVYRYKSGRASQEGEKKIEVAVKKLVGGGGGPMEKTLKDFKTECVLLSRLKHRNIIALVGATTHPVTCVMQYCSRGNLMVLLDDRSVELTWKMKRQMMLDVAEGMKYLHGQNPVIIHRDLKSLNVLIDEDWVTKVTDFGLSRFKATSVSEKMTGQAGTYHWMAPEVINSQHYTEKADVFSYGIILWEIFTRAIPYGGMQPVQVVAAVLGRKERPRIPSRCPQALSQLMRACWSHDPDHRPCFDDIVPWLESL